MLRRVSIDAGWWVQKFLRQEQLLDCMSAFAQLHLALEHYDQQLKDDKAQEAQYAATKNR
jgi:hypothetical protein